MGTALIGRFGVDKKRETKAYFGRDPRAMLDSGQLTRDQNSTEAQSQVPPVGSDRTAGLVAGATGQTEK